MLGTAVLPGRPLDRSVTPSSRAASRRQELGFDMDGILDSSKLPIGCSPQENFNQAFIVHTFNT
jgi:hypothetical protein